MASLTPAIALAIMISAALPEQALARCDRGDRISHRDAECLSAYWYNPRGLSAISEDSWFEVMNRCAHSGKVVAKVDIAGDMDRTLHLDRLEDAEWRVRGKDPLDLLLRRLVGSLLALISSHDTIRTVVQTAGSQTLG